MSSRRYVGWKTSILPAIAAAVTTVAMMPSAADAATATSVWSIVKSPNVTTGTFATNAFASVSAVSDTNVWAAGFDNTSDGDSSTDAPLIEHWNGTTWSVSLKGTQNAALTGISVDSATDAWAVGNVLSNNTLLAEHWNGSTWSTAAMPVPGDALSVQINGVTALSATNAWAVGTFANNDLLLPLIEHWNGTAWSIAANVPRQVSDANELLAVTAVSADDIWAVGEFDQGGTSPESQLLMHWNGTSWSLSKLAQIGAGESNAFPVAVTAVSSNDVWAVGGVGVTFPDGSTSEQPFSEHWDGTQWTEVETPAPAVISASFAFTSAAAVSANDVWGVGLNAAQSFIEHWNGSAWTTVATPTLGADSNSLEGIAKSGTSSLWAVGDNRPKSPLISQSLTIHTTQG